MHMTTYKDRVPPSTSLRFCNVSLFSTQGPILKTSWPEEVLGCSRSAIEKLYAINVVLNGHLLLSFLCKTYCRRLKEILLKVVVLPTLEAVTFPVNLN